MIEVIARPDDVRNGRLPWIVRRKIEQGLRIVDRRTVRIRGVGERVVFVLERGDALGEDGSRPC